MSKNLTPNEKLNRLNLDNIEKYVLNLRDNIDDKQLQNELNKKLKTAKIKLIKKIANIQQVSPKIILDDIRKFQLETLIKNYKTNKLIYDNNIDLKKILISCITLLILGIREDDEVFIKQASKDIFEILATNIDSEKIKKDFQRIDSNFTKNFTKKEMIELLCDYRTSISLFGMRNDVDYADLFSIIINFI